MKTFKTKRLNEYECSKKEAEVRHRYMEQFIEQFMKEWNAQI